MNRSSEEIEQDVEATRGDLDRTVEALKDKASPGQLIDELARSFKGDGASGIIANLGTQARENPMAVAMIGAGVAWLIMGKGGGSASAAAPAPTAGGAGANRAPYGASGQIPAASVDQTANDLGDMASSLKDKASDVAAGSGAALADAASGLKQKVADAAGHARHGAEALGGEAAHVSHKVQRSFMELLDQEPMIIGALGVAIGAALGAALPSTRVEDRAFGELRDQALNQSKEKVQAAMQGAMQAGAAALDAVREEADQQGLTGEQADGSLLDKVQSVGRAGVEAAKDEIQQQQPGTRSDLV